MREPLAEDAARTIRKLLKAHMDGAESIDYNGAMSVVRELENAGEKKLPKEGDVLVDTEAPHWSNDRRVEVTEVTDKKAYEVYLDKESGTTVANYGANIEFPDDDPVVEVEYLGGTDNEYYMPVSRLAESRQNP